MKDTTEVRLAEGWQRVYESCQTQRCAMVNGTWKPSGARKRTPLWQRSVGFAQMRRITTIGSRGSCGASLKKDLSNDGCTLEIYNKVISVALETSFRIPFSQTHTPQRFFLDAQNSVIMTQANRWVWRLAIAMRGWGNDGQPDLLPMHQDDAPGPAADNE